MRARTTKKRTNPSVDRVGVAISKDVRGRAMVLAKEEKRSFSNFVTMLIEREWERQGKVA